MGSMMDSIACHGCMHTDVHLILEAAVQLVVAAEVVVAVVAAVAAWTAGSSCTDCGGRQLWGVQMGGETEYTSGEVFLHALVRAACPGHI